MSHLAPVAERIAVQIDVVHIVIDALDDNVFNAGEGHTRQVYCPSIIACENLERVIAIAAINQVASIQGSQGGKKVTVDAQIGRKDRIVTDSADQYVRTSSEREGGA